MQDNPERQKGVGKLQYLLGQREKGYFLKCKYCSGAACCRLFHLLPASWQIHLLSNVHLSSYFLTSYFHWLLEATCARTERQNVLLQEGSLERMQVEHSVGTAQSCGAQHMGGLGTWNARSLARWKNGGWGRGKRLWVGLRAGIECVSTFTSELHGVFRAHVPLLELLCMWH